MLKLELISGPRKGRHIRVSDDVPVSIGRSVGRLRLHDSRVSKDHAEIVFDGVSWVLRDLGSSNGSYVNGDRLTGLAELERGDTLQFGRVRVKVREANRTGVRHVDPAEAGLTDAGSAQAPAKPAPPKPVPEDTSDDEPAGLDRTPGLDDAFADAPPFDAAQDDDGELDLDALFAEAEDADDEDDADDVADDVESKTPSSGYTNTALRSNTQTEAPPPTQDTGPDAVPIEDEAEDPGHDPSGSSAGGINIESGVFDPVPGAAGWEIEPADDAADDSSERLGESAVAEESQEQPVEAEAQSPAVAAAGADAPAGPAALDDPDEDTDDPEDAPGNTESQPDADDRPATTADQVRIDDDTPSKPASGGTTLKLPHETLAAAAGSDRSAAMTDASRELRKAQEDSAFGEEDAIGLADDRPSVFDDATAEEPPSPPQDEAAEDHDHDLVRIGDDTPIGPASVLDERELTPTVDTAGESVPMPEDLSADGSADAETDEGAQEEAEVAEPLVTETPHEDPATEPVADTDTEDSDHLAEATAEEDVDTVSLEALLAAEAEDEARAAVDEGVEGVETEDEPVAEAEPQVEAEAADQAKVTAETSPSADTDADAESEPPEPVSVELDDDGPAVAETEPAEDEPHTESSDAQDSDDAPAVAEADAVMAAEEHAPPAEPETPSPEPTAATPPEHAPPAAPVDVSQLRAALAKLHGPGVTPTLAPEADAAEVVSSIVEGADAVSLDADTESQADNAAQDPGETDYDAPSPASFAAGLGTADAVADELDRDQTVAEHAALVEAATQAAAGQDEDASATGSSEGAAPLAAQPRPGVNPTSTLPPTEPRTSRRSVPNFAERPHRRGLAIAAGIALLLAAAAGLYFSGVITLPTIAGRDTPGLPDNTAPDANPPLNPGTPGRNTPNNPGTQNPGNNPGTTPPDNPRNTPGPGTTRPDRPTPPNNPAAVDPFTNTARVLGAAALAGRTTDDRSVRVPTDPNTPTTDPPTDTGTTPRNPNNLPPLVIPEDGNPANPTDNPQDNNPGDSTQANNPPDDNTDNPQDNTNPAVPADGDRLVFLVDCSGSLVDSLPQMLLWLRDAIGTLSPDETFTIIFFKQDQAIETPPAGLQPLTRAYQRNLIANWLDDNASPVLPAGRSDPTAGLQLALSYNPSDIYLLSDESFGQRTGDTTPDQAVRYVTELVADTDVRLHGVQFFYDDTDGALQNLAEQFNGTYEFVQETRHPERDPIDLLEELENRNR